MLNNAVSALHEDLNSINRRFATNLLVEFLKQFVSMKLKARKQLTSQAVGSVRKNNTVKIIPSTISLNIKNNSHPNDYIFPH